MIRKMLRGMVAALVVTLAGCGGGSDTCVDVTGGTACNGSGGGGSTVTVSDLVLVLSSASIPNTGTATVTAVVTALDANRNALPNAPVVLSANSDAVLTVAGNATTTSDAGVISAAVSIGSVTTLRTITVTATSGNVTRSANLSVVAGTDAVVPATIELISSATSVGTGGDTVVVTAFVKDGNNNSLPSTPVTFSTSTGTLSNVSSSTNASGAATASFSAGSDKANRSATITVNAGAISRTLTLPITGSKLSVSGPGSLTLGSTAASYVITAVDSTGNALPNVAISAASGLGNAISPTSAVTDASGQAQFQLSAAASGQDVLTFAGAGATAKADVAISGDNFAFTAPTANALIGIGLNQTVSVRFLVGGVAQSGQQINFAATGGTLSSATALTNSSGVASVSISATSAGPVIVQASVNGGTASATLPVSFIATDPDKLVLQVSQAALAPNPVGTSDNRTLVVARVTDPAGNPVQGQVVNFQRVTDPSGGSLQQASATTDSSGQATVTYVSGSESTATNGVVIRAAVASEPAVAGEATLTVNQTALFITLGTGNEIGNANSSTYQKNWVVYVTDANGVAVSGVSLSLKALPTHYLRGVLVQGETFWVYEPTRILICPSEDLDGDGILDTSPNEDANGDGVLWPGNVVAVSPGTVTTDSTGRAVVSLTYAESFAPWVRVRLTASARVSGTESRRDAEFIIDGSVPDFRTTNVPAGVASPFGDYQLPLSSPSVTNCVQYN